MKITDAFLKEHAACVDGAKWVAEQCTRDGEELVKLLITHNLEWANWLIARMLNTRQRIQYAMFAAEQVIAIYESRYPGDDRPRAAIRAAKAVLENNNAKTRAAAYTTNAAAHAATNATNAANAANAAYAAANAANAAANAANAAYAAAYATNAAAYAANAAANAANAANAAAYATNAAAYETNAVAFDAAMKEKIVRHGLEIWGIVANEKN